MRVAEKSVYRSALLAALAALILAGPAWAGQSGKSPVKVFILAGQSNMEGQGFIGGTQKGTLEALVKDPASAPRYKHLVADGGKWAVRDDVWCAYGQKGKLTVGGYAASGAIGPELGFGWIVGDYLDNQVLLIKVAVGGTSLAQNWRPPSSGGEVGGWYKEMIRSVKEQLQNLKTDFPDYDGKGYEIVGFCWHQGWQDGCVDAMANEYEKNMVNFIKDIRKDLGIPNLPFVIGGSGFGGWEQKVARRLKISAAQKAAAQREEFKGNVLYVETRGFFRPREVSPTGFGYHWNCNAETYYLIGEGMGKAMVELLGGPKAPANATDPTPKKVKRQPGLKAPPPAVVKLEELTLDLGNKVTMKLLKIPAGKFLMGSPQDEEGRRSDEGPQHEATISKPFYMGVYEVTVEQFDQFVKDSGYAWEKPVYSFPRRGDHPATHTTMDDAKAFCQWLSKKTGKTVSLPTEAQWEYACRAGTSTAYCFGDDAEDLVAYGHHSGDGWDGTAGNSPLFAQVGSFKPNAFGLYDMHGNVLEWCSDFYAAYSADRQTDPTGPATGGKYVARGGDWSKSPDACRSARRYQAAGGRAFNRDGFRVVVAVQ
jgi:alpha-galactosidase